MIPDYHSDDFATARLEDTVSLRSAAREETRSQEAGPRPSPLRVVSFGSP